MKVDLLQFCSKDEDRPYLEKPIAYNGYIYYTDGKIVIRAKSEHDLPQDVEWGVRTEKIFGIHLEHVSKNIATIPPLVVKQSVCSNCDGLGDEPKCPSCEGNGTIDLQHSWLDRKGKWNHSYYLVECKECEEHPTGSTCHVCGGRGCVIDYDPEQIECGTQLFMAKTMERIVGLPNLQLFNSKELMGGAYFTFDGGDGLIMPARKMEKEE